MKNDTPNSKRGQRLLRDNPQLLVELLREQTKIIQSLHEQIEKQNQLIEQLREELTRTRQQFEEAQRAGHRQAAPFRIEERQRKGQPGKPGRPAGHPGACRPKPDPVDQTIDVPLERCPQCGGPLHDLETVEQFIEELPPIRPTVFRLLTRRACCPQCGDVASTHPLQTTTASGAAGVHLGPRALAVALDLNRAMGLTMRKTCRVLGQLSASS
jgi:transposase